MPLFPGDSEIDQLFKIFKVLGMFMASALDPCPIHSVENSLTCASRPVLAPADPLVTLLSSHSCTILLRYSDGRDLAWCDIVARLPTSLPLLATQTVATACRKLRGQWSGSLGPVTCLRSCKEAPGPCSLCVASLMSCCFSCPFLRLDKCASYASSWYPLTLSALGMCAGGRSDTSSLL